MPRNRKGVRVTLYLPDELRERARKAGLNLSGILRRAVEQELRGETTGGDVELERVGDSIELRISVPVGELRDRLR